MRKNCHSKTTELHEKRTRIVTQKQSATKHNKTNKQTNNSKKHTPSRRRKKKGIPSDVIRDFVQ
jgi:hypothetical protein